MAKRGQLEEFIPFLERTTIGTEIAIVRLYVDELPQVIAAVRGHAIDYDDAYQYVAAELNGLKLVSLDTDFDHTPTGRLTPIDALRSFKEEPH